MRKLYWAIKIISALVGLVFLANMTVPNWQTDLSKWLGGAGPQAVNWGTQTYNKITHPNTGASPSAAPAPGSHSTRPTPQPVRFVPAYNGPSGASSSTTNTIAGADPNGYSQVAIEGPAPAPLSLATENVWSNATCHTMIEDMAWDANLDAQTANQDRASNSALSTYYANWSAHWQTVVDDMNAGPCAYTVARLSGAQCSDPQSWFAIAITGHQTDETAHQANKSWDDQWIAIYQQMQTLWGAAGCSS